MINIKTDFGAVGDGVTDDTVAIQNALNYANTSGIGEIYAPAGVYLTGEIAWPGNSIALRGESCGYTYNSSGTPRTTFKAKAGCGTVFNLIQTGQIGDRTANYICDIQVDGTYNANYGISCSEANIFERVKVTGCLMAGIRFGNATNSSRIINCALLSNFRWGLVVEGGSTTTYSVKNTNISLNNLGGANLEAGVVVNFSGCIIESNGGPGLRIYRPDSHYGVIRGFSFDDCWFEDNASVAPYYTIVVDAQTRSIANAPQCVSFSNSRISSSYSDRKYAYLGCVDRISFERNTQFETSTQTDAITATSNARYIEMVNPFGLTATQSNNAIASGIKCMATGDDHIMTVGVSPAVSFLTGWTNYGGTFAPAQYWFDNDGYVNITGSIKGPVGSPAFILPVGFRPANMIAFGTDSNGAHGLVYVYQNGQVVPYIGSNTISHLNGLKFKP